MRLSRSRPVCVCVCLRVCECPRLCVSTCARMSARHCLHARVRARTHLSVRALPHAHDDPRGVDPRLRERPRALHAHALFPQRRGCERRLDDAQRRAAVEQRREQHVARHAAVGRVEEDRAAGEDAAAGELGVAAVERGGVVRGGGGVAICRAAVALLRVCERVGARPRAHVCVRARARASARMCVATCRGRCHRRHGVCASPAERAVWRTACACVCLCVRVCVCARVCVCVCVCARAKPDTQRVQEVFFSASGVPVCGRAAHAGTRGVRGGGEGSRKGGRAGCGRPASAGLASVSAGTGVWACTCVRVCACALFCGACGHARVFVVSGAPEGSISDCLAGSVA